VDTEGRIDKFVKKQKESQAKKLKADEVKKTRAKKKSSKAAPQAAPTLKEMLEEARKKTS